MTINRYRVETPLGSYWDIACENEHEALKQIRSQIDPKRFEGQKLSVRKIGEV